MLRLVTPSEAPITVPWTVDSADRRHPLVRFDGRSAAEAVRVFRRDVSVEHWGRMHAGESAVVCLCGADTASELLTLAWFDPPTDTELLWGFVVGRSARGTAHRGSQTPPAATHRRGYPQIGPFGRRARVRADQDSIVPRPTITKVSTPEGLLALLPVLAGMPLVDSLVIAPFVRGRTIGALRTDQPPADATTAEMATFASNLLGMVAKIDDCDLLAVALYTSDSWRDSAPRQDLVAAVVDRFAAEGYSVAEALCVAADGWGPLAEGGEPRPWELVEQASQEWSAAHSDVQRNAQPLTSPHRDDILAARVGLAFGDLVAGVQISSFGVATPVVLPEPIDHLERLLRPDAPPAGAVDLATLIALIAAEGDVDRTVLQIAFGRKVAVSSWRGTLAARAGAAAAGISPLEWLQRHGSHHRRSRTVGLLMGTSDRVPLRARLGRGTDLIARAATHAPRDRRAPLLCALAWLYWSLGRSSLAMDTLQTAASEHPEYEMSGVLATVFEITPLPQWLYARLQRVA